MYQVPQTIWNQIAQQPQMQTPLYQDLFSLPESEIDQALDEWANLLEQNGMSSPIVTPYQTLDPLLKEQEAISAWLNQQPTDDQLQLRQALPELLSPQEAAILAQQDNPMLTPQLLKELEQALTQPTIS